MARVALGWVITGVVAVLAVIVGAAVLLPSPNGRTFPSRPGPPLHGPTFVNATVESGPSGAWFNFTVGSKIFNTTWSDLAFDVEAPGGYAVVPGPNWTVTVLAPNRTTEGEFQLGTGAWASGGGGPVAPGDLLVFWVDLQTAVKGCYLIVTEGPNQIQQLFLY